MPTPPRLQSSPYTRAVRRVTLTLLLCVALAGCGGGSGSGPRKAPASGGKPVHHTPTVADARRMHANEAGRLMVLEYHRVGGDLSFAPEWTISAAAFRRELTYLRDHDYFPINVRDLLADHIDVPAGKTPVALTFDDSSDSQFTLVRRGGKLVPDPGGAVGVLADFHRRHPDWPLRATWFVLPKADRPNHLFDQDKLATRKLRYLVGSGMEVGSHTLYHANLQQSPPAMVQEQLARADIEIHKHLPGYRVVSLAVPFGAYPADIGLLKQGSWRGHRYTLRGALEVSGGPSWPPGDRRFDPYRIPRVQTGSRPDQSHGFLRALTAHPATRYVSDGDPDVISFPVRKSGSLDLKSLRAQGKVFRGY